VASLSVFTCSISTGSISSSGIVWISILKSGSRKSVILASMRFESRPSVSSSTLDLEIFGLLTISSTINPPSFKLSLLISFATALSGSENVTFKTSSWRDSFFLRSLTLGIRTPLFNMYSSISLKERIVPESPEISRNETDPGSSSRYSSMQEKICS